MKVVITGGSSFVAGHLIRELHEAAADVVSEIHTIDRKAAPSNLFEFRPGSIPVTHHSFDLNDEEANRRDDPRELRSPVKSDHERYTRDNLNAVECLIEAMFNANVQNLVFLSDAYANVPSWDNFGNSEEIHDKIPSSCMLGHYGHTRAEGELFARQKPFQATFLRSTVLYGEGETKLPAVLKTVAEANGGRLPTVRGPSNGLLQCTWAVWPPWENMRLLLTAPDRCTGEFLYCMDRTDSRPPSSRLSGLELAPGSSLAVQYGRTLWNEWVRGGSSSQFSLSALRLLFIYAIGFTNRKQQLIFKFRSPITQEDAFKRTLQWISANLVDGKPARPVPELRRAG
ncbi:3-beta hydroxysteroid dehydrogenase/isomerase domain and NAD(P)-binding domain-containing protein [Aphelenchoides fujianensis]|nr:3-beta hydroxysteroid dehydrogenase/isomerase domain and NAD(P)-binding domain-containing protein [Aphelenchoides fujianensis]